MFQIIIQQSEVEGDVPVSFVHLPSFAVDSDITFPGRQVGSPVIVRPPFPPAIAERPCYEVSERKETIQDAVYEFVTSPAFRNRVEEISRQYRMLDAEIGKTKDYMGAISRQGGDSSTS